MKKDIKIWQACLLVVLITGLIGAPILAQPVTPTLSGALNPISGTTGTFTNLVVSAPVSAINFSDVNGTSRVTWGNGTYIHATGGDLVASTGVTAGGGRLSSRNASGGISVGIAGTEYFGIAAGSASIDTANGYFSQPVRTQMGTATSAFAKVGAVADVNTTGVGNVGASGPDDLQVYSLPANALTSTNRCVRLTASGTTANNANAKTVRITVGPTPTALITKALNVSLAGCTWKLQATICRTGASAQDYFAEAWNSCGTTVSSTDGATTLYLSTSGTLTQTETNALDLKSQSTASTSNNDIVSELLTTEYL